MTIYLDNSATTRQYDEVTDLMSDLMREDYGNPSSLHHMGVAAEGHLKKARRRLADAAGCSTDEIFFTSGGTESDNLALRGTAYARRRRGKKLVTTSVEHPAVLETFKALEKEGYDTEIVGVDGEGFVDLKQLEQAVDDETILVSIMHVNNEVGTIQPLAEAAGMKRNAYLHSDCVQSFGKMAVPAGVVDLASFSAHKIHGPKGVGALYVRKGINMIPQQTGGGQEREMRSGTENVPGIAGFGLAAETAYRDIEEETEKIAAMRDHLAQGIRDEIRDVRFNTPDHDTVCSILNVSFLGTRGEVILHTLEQSGIYVSTGSACSSRKPGSHVLSAMGLDSREIEGAIRFSLSRFNTMDEIEETVDALKKAVASFRRLGSFR